MHLFAFFTSIFILILLVTTNDTLIVLCGGVLVHHQTKCTVFHSSYTCCKPRFSFCKWQWVELFLHSKRGYAVIWVCSLPNPGVTKILSSWIAHRPSKLVATLLRSLYIIIQAQHSVPPVLRCGAEH